MIIAMATVNITEYHGQCISLVRSMYLNHPGVVAQSSAKLIGGPPTVLLVVQVPVEQKKTSWIK